MNNEIILYLPWPPSVNSYYYHSKRGTFVRKTGKEYTDAVIEAVEEQAPGVQFDDPIHLEVHMYPPDNKPRDLDNHMKGLQDSIVHAGLLSNDKLIDQLVIYRGVVIDKGLVVIEINEAGPLLTRP